MEPKNSQTAQMTPTPAIRAKAMQAYARQSRALLEEKWILDHLPLVKHIVNKVMVHARGKADLEDLISAGTVGLVKAARSFDPTREVEFKTYAYIRIRGAVIDELRRGSFVPSNVHQDLKRIEDVYRRMSARTGRPPGDEQLARAVKMPLEKLYKILQEGRHQHFLSIHGLSEEKAPLQGLVPPDQEPGPDQQAERKEMIEALSSALMELPERDRHVLLLYYERDLTMKETAQVLGVTESRVSQLHASALFKLSMKLGRNA
ncbi:MAG: FliA/WhiG family RNA polymerase sigma factor [Phycisphaerae bacterium]|nr:FliA/WhiG family RNA polymerase sigma factor [Phycisphaerae bacterium]